MWERAHSTLCSLEKHATWDRVSSREATGRDHQPQGLQLLCSVGKLIDPGLVPPCARLLYSRGARGRQKKGEDTRQPAGREARRASEVFITRAGTPVTAVWGMVTLSEHSALQTKEQSHFVLGQPSAPHRSHHGPSQAAEGTDQVLFPAAAALDPQVGAIVFSYASSGQGMCTAGPGRGLWTEAAERLKAPGWKGPRKPP